MLEDFSATFAAAMAPRERVHPSTFAARHVYPSDSARSARYDPDATPWMIDPMEAIADNRNREIVIAAPVGSGKTTLFEALVAYIIAEDPGGTMVTAQTDAEARLWGETRLWPMLRRCGPVKPLWPGDANNARKSELILPHMSLILGGASTSFLQSKSIRWLLSDECWLWHPGKMEEARRRQHDRWNARAVFVSQGGVSHDSPYSPDAGNPDFDAAFRATDMNLYHWICPECSAENVWRWEDVIYEAGDALTRDWAAVQQSAHLKCPACPQTFEDKPVIRRALSSASIYRPTNTRAVVGHRGYTYQAPAVWWIPLGKLAVEWLRALDAKGTGNVAPLRQFIQKRLAQPWQETEGDDEGDELKPPADYMFADVSTAEPLPDEADRIQTVDVQKIPYRHFYAVVRAYFLDGGSKLLWEGKLETYELVEELRKRFGVKPALTMLDGGHAPDEVADNCAAFGWGMLFGDHRDSFPNRRRGPNGMRTIYEPHTLRKIRRAPSGRPVPYLLWSNPTIKSVFARYRTGQLEGWEYPQDASDRYKSQITAEHLRIRYDAKKGRNVQKWVKRRRHDHLGDCEQMNLVLAMATKLVRPVIIEEDEEEQIDGPAGLDADGNLENGPES